MGGGANVGAYYRVPSVYTVYLRHNALCPHRTVHTYLSNGDSQRGRKNDHTCTDNSYFFQVGHIYTIK
jgi:hypothetical protein